MQCMHMLGDTSVQHTRMLGCCKALEGEAALASQAAQQSGAAAALICRPADAPLATALTCCPAHNAPTAIALVYRPAGPTTNATTPVCHPAVGPTAPAPAAAAACTPCCPHCPHPCCSALRRPGKGGWCSCSCKPGGGATRMRTRCSWHQHNRCTPRPTRPTPTLLQPCSL